MGNTPDKRIGTVGVKNMNVRTLGLFTLAVIIALSGSTLIVGCSTESEEEQLSTYNNPAYGINIAYPSDWTILEEVAGVVVSLLSPKESATDSFRENLNVVVNDLSAQPMTLDEYRDFTVDDLELLVTDLNIVYSGETTLSNSPAYELVLTGEMGGLDKKWMQVCTIKNDKAYVVTYTAEEGKYLDFLGIAQRMIDSFEIIASQ